MREAGGSVLPAREFGAHPQSVMGLKITGEIDRHPWHVRLHERNGVDYDVHIVTAEAVGS